MLRHRGQRRQGHAATEPPAMLVVCRQARQSQRVAGVICAHVKAIGRTWWRYSPEPQPPVPAGWPDAAPCRRTAWLPARLLLRKATQRGGIPTGPGADDARGEPERALGKILGSGRVRGTERLHRVEQGRDRRSRRRTQRCRPVAAQPRREALLVRAVPARRGGPARGVPPRAHCARTASRIRSCRKASRSPDSARMSASTSSRIGTTSSATDNRGGGQIRDREPPTQRGSARGNPRLVRAFS